MAVKPSVCDADKLTQTKREEADRGVMYQSWKPMDDPIHLEKSLGTQLAFSTVKHFAVINIQRKNIHALSRK